jgi:tetratricopeptide (TPR) repeat protein
LEGSVRSSGARLLVTTQLVRGSDASHVWTGEYDRALQNILDVQQQVSVAVAEEIHLTLDAVEYFERALSRNPGYALAYAGLADAYLVLGGGYLPNVQAYNQARAAAQKALELDKHCPMHGPR